jgi:hypothetical protein
MHAVVGELERKRTAKAQQALRVASETRTRTLDGIVEKLQALRPAGFPRRQRCRFSRPQRIERNPSAQRDDNQYDNLGHPNPPSARPPRSDVEMGAGTGNASASPLRSDRRLRLMAAL